MRPGVQRSLYALALPIAMLAVRAAPAHDDGGVEDRWLAGLTERIVADLVAGKPLVVEVHAPLCDNTIIQCGNAKLGDGDNPDTNLYWSTTPGLGSWFARRDGGPRRSRGPGGRCLPAGSIDPSPGGTIPSRFRHIRVHRA